jgi:purine nucleosidase
MSPKILRCLPKGNSMPAPRKIIIDTDPGQDDAVAILLALGSPEALEILGITAVAGNVPLALTQKNVRIICETAGKMDIKVYAGCDRPMTRALVTAEYVHGQSGLDGPELFEPTIPLQDQHGVDFIIETLRNEPAGTVTLCTLGALTNIATAFTKAPDIVPKVQELVMMGGGFFEGGNITPAAEFNIYVDPEAADIVMKSGVPVVMMPLDVTHKVLTLKRRVKKIAALDTKVSKFVTDMLDFFERFDVEKYGSDGGPLHDPTVIAYLLKPDLFSGRMCNVEIETQSPLTVGMTVVDWWQVTNRPHNALVMRGIDADGFFDLLTERLARL